MKIIQRQKSEQTGALFERLNVNETVLVEDLIYEIGRGFRVRWIYSDSSARVDIWRSSGSMDKAGEQLVFDPSCIRHEAVDTTDDVDTFMSGYIKDDGCGEITGGDHHCDMHDYQQQSDLLKYVWNRSRELLTDNGVTYNGAVWA